MNVHLYFTFSLDPGNSNIKSCVTPAALILFGLFLFLHKCFTSLLLWYLSSSRKSTSLFFVLNDIIGVDLGYKWKEHVPINVRVLLNCPYQSQMIYFNNSLFLHKRLTSNLYAEFAALCVSCKMCAILMARKIWGIPNLMNLQVWGYTATQVLCH